MPAVLISWRRESAAACQHLETSRARMCKEPHPPMNERYGDLSIKPFDGERPTVNLRCCPLRQATVWLLVKPVHFTM